MTTPKRSRKASPTPRTADRHARAGVLVREAREGQIEGWREAAARAGVPLSNWIRDALDRAADA